MNKLKKFKDWAKMDLWEDTSFREHETDKKKILEMYGSGRGKLYLEYEKGEDQDNEAGFYLLRLMKFFDWSFFLEFESIEQLKRFSKIV